MKIILIADDKASGRELVRTVLENAGYRVVEACDGIEAIEVANRVQPHLIILDLHMPGLDGFSVVKELRSQESCNSLPIIALTASAMEGDKHKAMTAGFTGYISKPVSLSHLRAEVGRLLD